MRHTLDSLARSTDTPVGRVRLRESKTLVPRVFVDGSIELSMAFIRRVPPEEQAFLIAAALYQRKSRQPVLTVVAWCLGVVVCPLLLYILLDMIPSPGLNAVPLKHLALPFGLYFVFWLLHGPKYDGETLKFALKATGNLDAVERVIRREDRYETEKRLTQLREWWEKRQLSTASAMTAIPTNTASPVQQQQTLGRKT